MLEIYCGTAKEKKRLCAGAAVHAAARGQEVLAVSFAPAEDDRVFDALPRITHLTPQGTSPREFFDGAVRMALTFRFGLLILDGVFDAVSEGALPAGEVYDFLANAPDRIGIICTGATAEAKFLSLADNAVELKSQTR